MSHSEKIAADKTSLGFEFQDFVYIEKLIGLGPGQKLGLELHDDIHVETITNEGLIANLLLIQVKHSINPGNITDRDIDLWKTIYNWLMIIPTLPPHRTLTLQLYTNKKLNSQPFISLLKSPYRNIQAILDHIRNTEQEISLVESKKTPKDPPNPLAKYVQSISNASDDQLKHIFENFEFHNDNSSIIDRLNFELIKLSIPTSRLDDTRKHVIGAFKESKFSRIIKGEKVVITFDNFRTEMGFDRIVRSARSEPADFDQFVDMYYSYQRPDTLSFSNSKFSDQLKDIGISDEEIIERGIEMMLAEQFMEKLQEMGSFSANENLTLENKAVSQWQLLHRQLHRNTREDDEIVHKDVSQDCYYQTINRPLKAGNIEIPIHLSCGKYVKLSNLPRIGWRKDWQGKFKK